MSYVAGLARLELNADETEKFQKQLGNILEFVEALQKIDISSVPDAAIDCSLTTNVLRVDEIRPSLTAEDVIRNAPKSSNNLIIMPKIVE